MNALLERFCRYVRVESTAVEVTDDYPSSQGQLELGQMLAGELRELRLDDVCVDEYGIVMATVPGNVNGAPTMAWVSHMDTSPEASGHNVKPIVHEHYDGKDIVLPGDPSKIILATESEDLPTLTGKTIITSDGTTLLGADDKCGIAVIVTAAAELMARPEVQHGPIRIVFTCDEEVGHGTDKLDLNKIDAAVAYTLDGESEAIIEGETFSADLANVTITGRNIHPGLATGKMVNAIRLAGLFLSRMPWQRLAPETTSERDGFMHPYVFEGAVDRATIRIILRSFVTAELEQQADILRAVASTILAEHPQANIDIEVKEQYRNMAEFLAKEPRVMTLGTKAIENAGLTPRVHSIRGGTDGSRLSEMGLPTPNLSTGMHNFHSPLEFACLEQMQSAVKVLVELATLWGKERG